MSVFKRVIGLSLALPLTASFVMAQASGATPAKSSSDMTVEESYLQEPLERIVIRDQSRVPNKDNKMIALEYIREAIEGGDTGEEICAALEFLALEGAVNRATENGRLANNFPEVRAKAVQYLGDLGTPEAKNTLLKVMLVEAEPVVLVETIKSLGKIGINENDETANVIAWIVSKFDFLHPDNLLALAALDTYEKLAQKAAIRNPSVVRSVVLISEGTYVKPVQERAKQVIVSLRRAAAQSQQK